MDAFEEVLKQGPTIIACDSAVLLIRTIPTVGFSVAHMLVEYTLRSILARFGAQVAVQRGLRCCTQYGLEKVGHNKSHIRSVSLRCKYEMV
jgi:hypothetical protein